MHAKRRTYAAARQQGCGVVVVAGVARDFVSEQLPLFVPRFGPRGKVAEIPQPCGAEPLRAYQSAAVEAVMSSAARTVCLVAPTGAGKTRMGVEVVRRSGCRSAWIVHRRELEAQARARLPSDTAVVSVQSLTAGNPAPGADLVVLDECHHYASDEWRTVLDDYPGARIVGLTATPQRSDGRGLRGIFSDLVVAAHYSQLLAEGHLVDCTIWRPAEHQDGDLAADPVAKYLEHGEGGSGFVYCRTVEESKALAVRFCEAGIPSVNIDASTPVSERDGAIAALRAGSVRLLTNVYVLTEGVDVPHARVCILARNVGHASIFLQMAGRVLRPSPGKRDAILIDLPGVTHLFGSPVDDREYSLEGRGITAAKAPPLKTCLKCGATFRPVPACPRCGFVNPVSRKEQQIHDRELCMATATPADRAAELNRLIEVATSRGWSIEWAAKQYAQRFGVSPNLTPYLTTHGRSEFARLRKIAADRGYKSGFAAVRFKGLFGMWPPKSIQFGA